MQMRWKNLTFPPIPDVILLNGSSSAGKSSIAKELRQKLRDSGSAVIISLDDYLQMSADELIWENERGDRCTGSAEASLQYLYPKTGYDLCVDSSEAGSAALAEVIFRKR